MKMSIFSTLARTLSDELRAYSTTPRSLKAVPSFNEFQTGTSEDGE